MRRYLGLAATMAIAAIAWVTVPSSQTMAVAAAATFQSPARIFASKCAGCHGPDGSGNIAGTPNFTDAGWQAGKTDAELAASIKDGKGKIMPAWGRTLTDAQITGLVAHIRSLKK